MLGIKLNIAIRYRINSTLGNRYAANSLFCHRNKPLIGQHWLYHLASASADGHHVFMRHSFLQKALFFQIFQHRFAAIVTVHALVGSRAVFIDFGIQREDGDERQVMALAASIVVEVVRACNFHAAAAKFAVHKIVCNHRDFAVTQWQINHLAD